MSEGSKPVKVYKIAGVLTQKVSNQRSNILLKIEPTNYEGIISSKAIPHHTSEVVTTQPIRNVKSETVLDLVPELEIVKAEPVDVKQEPMEKEDFSNIPELFVPDISVHDTHHSSLTGEAFLGKHKHQQRVHEKRHTFYCQVRGCQVKTDSQSKLFDHIKSDHPQKRFQCHMCPRSFDQTSDLYKHKFTHSNLRPHQCKECGKKFKLRGSYVRHNNTHVDSTSECEVCGKKLKISSLKSHMTIHARETTFCCKHCARTFCRSTNRDKHEASCPFSFTYNELQMTTLKMSIKIARQVASIDLP
eukprot:sb/3467317/